jgi:hypothetical protein
VFSSVLCEGLAMTTDSERVEADPKVATRLPLVRGWQSQHRMPDGRIVTVDHRWVSLADWERSSLSSEPAWSVERLGPFVLATRLLG